MGILLPAAVGNAPLELPNCRTVYCVGPLNTVAAVCGPFTCLEVVFKMHHNPLNCCGSVLYRSGPPRSAYEMNRCRGKRITNSFLMFGNDLPPIHKIQLQLFLKRAARNAQTL
ncbi:hypothetical protein LSM04_005344 [Trypanosoma melophagium]|uniref:uncharacterized protein n=1 Tax=Trypanosoma melophagium TaxID=715481 RepID=UPI00351A3398|nr:hypothetical protein LSM04_005344 [Trypanosoma melophagium]